MTSARLRFRGDASPEAFREALRRLKERGCNLLVTGAVPAAVTDRATRRLLGSPHERRKRVLVLSDPAAGDASTVLPSGVDPRDDSVTVLEWTGGTRGTATASESAASTPSGALPGDDLDALEAALLDAIDAYAAEGLDPAELRVSVRSLRDLLDRHDRETVLGTTSRVSEAVLASRGMAHYHVEMPDDDPVVTDLDPLFDARIELRRREGSVPEQRWHVPEYGTTTWVTL